MQDRHDEQARTLKKILTRGGIAFLVVFALFSFIVTSVGLATGFDGPAAFGDAFGTLNAVFSGAALLAVAATLWQAQRQLEIQQQELQQNTRELAGQREQLEQQSRHLARQEFASHFFQLLGAVQTAIHSVRISKAGHQYVGRQALTVFLVDWTDRVRKDGRNRKDLEVVVARYCDAETLYNLGPTVGLIVRLLEQALRHVEIQDEDLVPPGEKDRYYQMIRSNLSQAELRIIAALAGKELNGDVSRMCYRFDLLLHLYGRGELAPLAAVREGVAQHWKNAYRADERPEVVA